MKIQMGNDFTAQKTETTRGELETHIAMWIVIRGRNTRKRSGKPEVGPF